MAKITHIVVHYSATYADQNLMMKDIDKMHRARTPPFTMVGYHYVIRRDGVVEQGRPETMVGAQNTGKLGICCIGGLDRATGPTKGVDNRTPAQFDSLIKLIRHLLKRYPGAKVVGHRDLAPTQCPGFDVPAWWAKVQKKGAPEPKPTDPKAPAKTGYLGEQKTHTVQKGETWWSISQMYGLGVADLARANGASPTDTLAIGRVMRTTHFEADFQAVKVKIEHVEEVTDDVTQLRSKAAGAGTLGRWLIRIGIAVVGLAGWAVGIYTTYSGKPRP